MAHYFRSGMHSHRHPFYGFGANGQTAPAVPAAPGTMTVSGSLSKVPWGAAAISGGIMGLVAYGVCSGFGVPSSKATGIGVTMGLMTMVGQVASNLLKGWADDVMASTTAKATV